MTNINPVIELSQEQTKVLAGIWNDLREKLSPEDYLFIKVKLNRTRAKLTKTQTYRMTMNLARCGFEPIPEWLHELIDPTNEATK